MTEHTPDHSDDVETPKVDEPITSPVAGDEDEADDLGSGAFDVPSGAAPDAEAESHDKPSKAYLGRPELTPLYAMAGLADLAATVVREIANEQIAAYRARRAKVEDAVADTTVGDVGEKVSEGAQDANAQFSAFLAKAQQRTQELFEQAVAQYEHLADRGRVAVGDALDSAKQQRAKAEEKIGDNTQEGVEEFAAAAQKFADKVTALAQAAADRVSQATSAEPSKAEPAEHAEKADVPPAAATDAETSAEGTTNTNKES